MFYCSTVEPWNEGVLELLEVHSVIVIDGLVRPSTEKSMDMHFGFNAVGPYLGMIPHHAMTRQYMSAQSQSKVQAPSWPPYPFDGLSVDIEGCNSDESYKVC